MKRYNKLIEIGLALKPNLQHFRAFHVAAIFDKNRLVSLATNSRKSHPFAAKMGYPYAREGLHSECLAVIRARLENYRGHDLFVIRVDNNNLINFSRPCQFCKKMLKLMEFNNVFYSGREGELVRM